MNALIKIVRAALGLPEPLRLKTYNGPPYTSKQIMAATCKVMNVTELQFKSKRRAAEYVAARHVAMYLSVEMTKESYLDIARVFDKDHSTVWYAYKKISKRGRGRTKLNRAISAVKEELAS